jgi:hypothetical protein
MSVQIPPPLLDERVHLAQALAANSASPWRMGEEEIKGLGTPPQRAQHVEANDVARSFPDRLQRLLPVEPRPPRLLHISVTAESSSKP